MGRSASKSAELKPDVVINGPFLCQCEWLETLQAIKDQLPELKS